MPRLFTAISAPSEITDRLSKYCRGLPGARWIEPSDFHITLRFIGDIDGEQAARIAETLAGIEHGQIQLSLKGIDVFGSKKPRLLYAGVLPDENLVSLQQKQARLIRQLGYSLESRKFVPHITLARFGKINMADLAAFLSLNGGIESPAFVAEKFALFSARESVGGGPYVIEQSYPLNG